MGYSDWEQGTIVLPSAAVAPLKQALRKAQNEMHATVLAEAKRVASRYRDLAPARGHLVDLPQRTAIELHVSLVVQSRAMTRARADARNVGLVTSADVAVELGDLATSRTTEFRAGQASIVFDGRILSWETGEGRGAVERARQSYLWQTLESHLRSTTWTRGTGGVLVGNNEYNEESRGESGDYIVKKYGPRGDEQAEGFAGYARSAFPLGVA